MSAVPVILPFRSASPAPLPAGYAAMPRQATRMAGLSDAGHRVLTAIIGLCYGDDRQTRAPCARLARPRASPGGQCNAPSRN